MKEAFEKYKIDRTDDIVKDVCNLMNRHDRMFVVKKRDMFQMCE